jgi:hypothetical protein
MKMNLFFHLKDIKFSLFGVEKDSRNEDIESFGRQILMLFGNKIEKIIFGMI